jgi:hypothetical protein
LLHHTKVLNYHYQDTQHYLSKPWFEPVISNEQLYELEQNSFDYWFNFISSLPEEVLQDYYSYSGVDYINKRFDERALTYL